MEVQFLTPEHAAERLRLRVEALELNPEAFSASLEQYRSLNPEDVKKRLWSEEDAFVVGGFQDSHLVAMAGFYREQGPKSRHKGRVWGVYVTPGARRAGIGRTVMQALLHRINAIDGLDQVLLSVAATQVPAIRLYRSLGFESFGTEPRALRIGDRYIDEEHMVLRLMNRMDDRE